MRPARDESDIQLVAEMWVRAASRLAEQSLDQWQYPVKMHNIRAAVAAGTCWLVHDQAGDASGTITVDDAPDTNMWFPEDNPIDALYLHRMITEPSLAGREVGAALMDWAARRAVQAGKHWIRLDAWRSNEALHDYYLDRGFDLVRVVADPTGSGVCFQRAASVQLGLGPEVVELAHTAD